jgi:hypothetical protein
VDRIKREGALISDSPSSADGRVGHTLDETERLRDGSTDGEVVDGRLSDVALRVDDEHASERDSLGEMDAVVLGHLVRLVGELDRRRGRDGVSQGRQGGEWPTRYADSREEA